MVESVAQANARENAPYQQGVLLLVKAAQNQNGLRHADYGRYHKYCCRRMLRIRKTLGFTQSQKQNKKHIYVEKPVTADLVATNAKYLQILVFKCEAAWAYAMQMKQHASALSGGKAAAGSGDLTMRTNPNRLRVHYLKRFQKASQAADKLLKLSTGAIDDISLIEIEGYKAQMEAIYNMEKHNFEEALNNLLKAKLIFENIQSY
jgi:signal recognition particle subunit SRP68